MHNITTCEVEENTVHALKRKSKGKEMHLLVVSQQQVFDAIMEAHLLVGHKKVASTYNKVKAKYHTITESLCTLFI
jgi:hypothetical protein